MTYLITFACYGTHLHGVASASVDRRRNLPGSRPLDGDPGRLAAEFRRMDQPPYSMDAARRRVVLDALCERCGQQGWTLFAAHVRTTHVHVVVDAEVRPERIMNDIKSYASRRLNQAGFDEPLRRRWARHGSTRWLWKAESVADAMCYVVEGQGEAMAVFRREQ